MLLKLFRDLLIIFYQCSELLGHVDVARVLARSGADLSIRGTGAPGFAGKTAHDLAVAHKLSELGEELRPG